MLNNNTQKIKYLAGIQYYGVVGITASCSRALTMAIQADDTIEKPGYCQMSTVYDRAKAGHD